ncbi:hypothetical protein NPIL_331751, partial [Nephila pilipes]
VVPLLDLTRGKVEPTNFQFDSDAKEKQSKKAVRKLIVETAILCNRRILYPGGHKDSRSLNISIDSESEANEGNFRALLRKRVNGSGVYPVEQLVTC